MKLSTILLLLAIAKWPTENLVFSNSVRLTGKPEANFPIADNPPANPTPHLLLSS
jgi:hypothetical protein